MIKRTESTWLVCCGVLALFLLSACTDHNKPHQFTHHVFGTVVQIQIFSDKRTAIQANTALEKEFLRVHQQWHAWEQGGLLYKINTAIANKQPITLSTPVATFLQQTQKISRQTQNLFNPAIGHLIRAWGFHQNILRPPPPNSMIIDHWLQKAPSMDDLVFKGDTLYSTNSAVHIDLGGIAKGYAGIIAQQLLNTFTIKAALINLGGDVVTVGERPHRAWRIGIADPKNPQYTLMNKQLCSGQSIFTSGTYARNYKWQGKTYHHLINPNTGYPAKHWQSVTVISHDPLMSDAAATALLIAEKKWHDIAQKLPIEFALLIDDKNQQTIYESTTRDCK